MICAVGVKSHQMQFSSFSGHNEGGSCLHRHQPVVCIFEAGDRSGLQCKVDGNFFPLSTLNPQPYSRHSLGLQFFHVVTLAGYQSLSVERYLIKVFPRTGCFFFGRYGPRRLRLQLSVPTKLIETNKHKKTAVKQRSELLQRLHLVAPAKGLGPRSWGKDFLSVAKECGRDLSELATGDPLLYLPDACGGFSNIPADTGRFAAWIQDILSGMPAYRLQDLWAFGEIYSA